MDYLNNMSNLPKQTKEFFSTYEEEKRKYHNNIFKTVHELAEMAFVNGIEILSIRIRDNWIEKFRDGQTYAGDRMNIPAPDVETINTDYMEIKVIK